MKGALQARAVEDVFAKYRILKAAIEFDPQDRPKEWGEYCRFIEDEVDKLDGVQREIIILRYMDDCETDIAVYKEMGIGETLYYSYKGQAIHTLFIGIEKCIGSKNDQED